FAPIRLGSLNTFCRAGNDSRPHLFWLRFLSAQKKKLGGSVRHDDDLHALLQHNQSLWDEGRGAQSGLPGDDIDGALLVLLAGKHEPCARIEGGMDAKRVRQGGDGRACTVETTRDNAKPSAVAFQDG